MKFVCVLAFLALVLMTVALPEGQFNETIYKETENQLKELSYFRGKRQRGIFYPIYFRT